MQSYSDGKSSQGIFFPACFAHIKHGLRASYEVFSTREACCLNLGNTSSTLLSINACRFTVFCFKIDKMPKFRHTRTQITLQVPKFRQGIFTQPTICRASLVLQQRLWANRRDLLLCRLACMISNYVMNVLYINFVSKIRLLFVCKII